MDAAAIYGIWLREMKRFFRVKSTFLSSLMRPVLWLLIMGGGLRPIVRNVEGVDNYLHFIFAGIVAMSLIFAAMQSAISIVWDREFGYLKEILAAPIPRFSVVFGKALSGSTAATIQGMLTLIFLPIIGLKIAWWMLPVLVACMFAISFSIASLGIFIAGKMSSFEGFGSIVNFLLMPMFFLSGAIYPVSSVPPFMQWLTFINPLTYGVDLMRSILVDVNHFPVPLSICVLVGFSLLMLLLALPLFQRD